MNNPTASHEPAFFTASALCQYSEHRGYFFRLAQASKRSTEHEALNSDRVLVGIRTPGARVDLLPRHRWESTDAEMRAAGWLVGDAHHPTLIPYDGHGVSCGTWGSVEVCTA